MAKHPRLYLAFDFGSKHIGIATGQTLTRTAEGLCRIKADNGIPRWQELDPIIKEWQPAALVIGLPLNMDGSESDMSRRARKFANRLADRYKLPTHMMDERLSSLEVKESHCVTDREIDSLAAAVILRNWFEQQLTETPSDSPS